MLEDTTALVVEDDTSLREIYKLWLTEVGVTVTEASDGDEAIEKWDNSYDIVVLDRHMPTGMSGGEALTQARQNGLRTPVMMVTAVEPAIDDAEMEFDAYLSKPTNRDTFLSTAKDLVQTLNIRDEVREFAMMGLKIHKLQENHSKATLNTHKGFQRLKNRYDELVKILSVTDNEFTDHEKYLLLQARERLDNPTSDSDSEPEFADTDTIHQSAD